ncbi:MAG: hypothetical protein OXG85_12260 [Chloroflexi bacterium]|nr:hypothetical protein [Chloroflexota bacterium]
MDEAQRAAEIATAQAQFNEFLLGFPNVVGTGIGYRRRQGQPTTELCLVVMVSRKRPLAQLDADAILPRQVGGAPIDVLETGNFAV